MNVNFLKKAWLPLLWTTGMLAACWNGAQRPTPLAFGRQVLSYAIGMALFFAVWTALQFAFTGLKALSRLWTGETVVEEEEDDSDPSYAAACAWRCINLALANPDHYEACDELGDLKRAGWTIEKSGHERGGYVYLKLIAPGHKD
jgi:hypothetical protein